MGKKQRGRLGGSFKKRSRRSRQPARQPSRQPSRQPARQPATPANGSEQPGAKKKVKLTKEQGLAVQLLKAREIVRARNVQIAKMRIREGKKVAELEVENADLTNNMMGSWNREEQGANDALVAEYGLPAGSVEYKLDENGCYYYEAEEGAQAPEDPADVSEETAEEKRGRLEAELAALEEILPDEAEVAGPEAKEDSEEPEEPSPTA